MIYAFILLEILFTLGLYLCFAVWIGFFGASMFSFVLIYVFETWYEIEVGERIGVVMFCLCSGFFLLRSLLSIISIKKRMNSIR